MDLVSKQKTSLAAAILLLLFALLTSGASQLSKTADETAYIAGGYAFLDQGREALSMLSQRGYPPLPGMLGAALIYLVEPNIPVERLEGWPSDYDEFAAAFEPYLQPMRRHKFTARMPIILLTVLLGSIVFRWAHDLWGARAGFLALTALALDPTLRAHGRLANSDVLAVTLGTAALYIAWRWSDEPSWHRAMGTGLLLGLTMLVKVSGLLWIAAAGLMIATAIIRKRQVNGNAQRWLQAIAGGGLSLLIPWAVYGFAWGPVGDFPLPLPAPSYWEGLRYLSQYKAVYFALEQRKYGSWWWYYPLAFAIKNPLPLLIGVFIGLFTLLRRPLSPSRLIALGFFPLLYTGIAISEGINVGYRYMLPIHPFLHLTLAGGLERWGWGRKSRPWRKWPLGVLGAWYAITAIQIHPYDIAYFNELIGGPNNGYRYLVDSNLAWGQAEATQDNYVQTHPDVQTQPPATRFLPAPGRYIVDASELQGVGAGAPDAYEWFRHREPKAIINHSLLVYEVPPYETDWIAQCSTPVAPLNEEAITEGMGSDKLRRLAFDCTAAWIYPNDEGWDSKLSGIYALHHDLIRETAPRFPSLLPGPSVPDDPFISRRLAQARLSFEQEQAGTLPAFALYELEALSQTLRPPSTHASLHAAPAAALPAEARATPPLSTPLPLTGPLTFLGAAPYSSEGVLEVETWWRVTGDTIERPFSIMAHLLTSDGENIGVADGLGVQPAAMETGDILVQRHRFPTSPEGKELWLRTGAYWLDTMEGWAVKDKQRADAFLMRLERRSDPWATSRP
jgi:4-amino-4-deoxy-L-arabinose transferase-like glycosyltransferase